MKRRVVVLLVYEGPLEWVDQTLAKSLPNNGTLALPNGATISRTTLADTFVSGHGTDEGRE